MAKFQSHYPHMQTIPNLQNYNCRFLLHQPTSISITRSLSIGLVQNGISFRTNYWVECLKSPEEAINIVKGAKAVHTLTPPLYTSLMTEWLMNGARYGTVLLSMAPKTQRQVKTPSRSLYLVIVFAHTITDGNLTSLPLGFIIVSINSTPPIYDSVNFSHCNVILCFLFSCPSVVNKSLPCLPLPFDLRPHERMSTTLSKLI